MAYVIALPCIGAKDTACVAVCPVDCIHPTKDEPGFESAEMLHINAQDCTDCGLCASECPVQAIFPDEDLPAEWSHFIEKNAAYYKDQNQL
jgi:NAD-dependent dihydropyrimidine dehydrogenase PreA subunit